MPLRTENESPIFSGITGIAQGWYTWVGFSSPTYSEALEMHRMYRERGYTGDILEARVDGKNYYRIVFGEYRSRDEALRGRAAFRNFLPRDAWLLALAPQMQAMPRSDWLSLAGESIQSEPPRTENESPIFSGITGIARGGYTWVGFSSSTYSEALEMHRTYRERGHAGDILEARVDGENYYRIVFGEYRSRDEALRGRAAFRSFLPRDAWLLILAPEMQIIPRSDWLPLDKLAYVEPDTVSTSHVAYIAGASSEAAYPTVYGEVKEREGTGSSPSLLSEKNEDNRPAGGSSDTPGNENRIPDDDPDPPDRSSQDEIPVPPSSPFLRRYFQAELQFITGYEDNVNHDGDVDAIRSYGWVPALNLQIRSSASDPLFTFNYIVARHDYSNTERWDRVSNKFRGVLEPQFSDVFRPKTSVELSLGGSSEDRDVSNQFQVVQEFEFRITRRHRLQLYGTYRVKRFPDNPGVQDFKPNVGINFVRTNSDGERFESGARYEINREQVERGNYRRWTFSVEYRSPEINDRDQFKIGLKHRQKYYTARFVEIEDEDFLRQDNRFAIQAAWAHRFNRGISIELNYEYETRRSNDPEKHYKANALSLALNYVL